MNTELSSVGGRMLRIVLRVRAGRTAAGETRVGPSSHRIDWRWGGSCGAGPLVPTVASETESNVLLLSVCDG